MSVSDASLGWETLEQYFLWQLITAHNIPVEHIMPILPKLDYNGECWQNMVFAHFCIKMLQASFVTRNMHACSMTISHKHY